MIGIEKNLSLQENMCLGAALITAICDNIKGLFPIPGHFWMRFVNSGTKRDRGEFSSFVVVVSYHAYNNTSGSPRHITGLVGER